MVDPRNVRLSKHFLLSDLMGCHSIYSRGFANEWDDPTGSKLAEAENLAQNILEPILLAYGPISISYGYISPELSRSVVAYQDPNKPSYHRYDDGAAADICVHRWVQQSKDNKSAPIMLAHKIDREGPPYSRLITYSESPYICIAGKVAETEARKHRQAFYENRFTGKQRTKPLFVTMSKDMLRRREQRLSPPGVNWRGAGYPTYHGGGIRQSQHIRTSKYTMLSDWLFNIGSIRHGIKNMPLVTEESMKQFKYVGAVYDRILDTLETARISIVQGWAGPQFKLSDYEDFHWSDKRFAFIIAAPHLDDASVYDAISEQQEVETAEAVGEGKWLVVGRFA
jgi:hypothetical protein